MRHIPNTIIYLIFICLGLSVCIDASAQAKANAFESTFRTKTAEERANDPFEQTGFMKFLRKVENKLPSDTSNVQKGWKVSALPGISYSSDQGFQVGALGHVYYHGNGEHYPQPIHDIGWELSWFTRGRTRAYVSYDSKFIIPNIRFNGSATFVNDPMYAFYGYNGATQRYDLKGMGPRQYGMDRMMLRVLGDFQGKIVGDLHWAAGIAYWGFWTDKMKGSFAAKYAKPEDGGDVSMYTAYRNYGLIRPEEKNGGHALEFKAGFMYDSRDQEAAPNRGIWAELYTYGSPDICGNSMSYLKLAAHFRHYVTLPLHWRGGGIVFAYHAAYQGTIAGEVPFYIQQNVNTLILRQMLSEGLGSSNTVRGLAANRIIGDGVVWANVDLRVKLVSFKLLKQFFSLTVCPFYDMGTVVQPYRAEMQYEFLTREWFGSTKNIYFDPSIRSKSDFNKLVYTPIHVVGGGAKFAWNENFIGSIEFAKCIDNRGRGMDEGDVWVSIGVGYAF